MSNLSMDLLATAEAAARLGITPRHVARLVLDGKLTPAAKAPGIRGAYLFDRSQIEALAKDGVK